MAQLFYIFQTRLKSFELNFTFDHYGISKEDDLVNKMKGIILKDKNEFTFLPLNKML